MSTDRERQLEALCRQLNENLMGAALCVKEIITVVQALRESQLPTGATPNGRHRGRAGTDRPLLDEATLSVVWHGKMIHLGHTQSFWILARLARGANQYVTHLDLIEDIWDDHFTDTAVLRAAVRRLRLKLRRGGMSELADAIVGHHGRYMLDLGLLASRRSHGEGAPDVTPGTHTSRRG
jgi:hypothetical protein